MKTLHDLNDLKKSMFKSVEPTKPKVVKPKVDQAELDVLNYFSKKGAPIKVEADMVKLGEDGLPIDPKALEGKTFVHFKGNRYQFVEMATDSETLAPLVVYRQLYGDPSTPNSSAAARQKLWVRPAKMFFEIISRDGYVGPRFQLEANS